MSIPERGRRRGPPGCAASCRSSRGCRRTTGAAALRRDRRRDDLGAARPGDDRLRRARRPAAAGRALHAAGRRSPRTRSSARAGTSSWRGDLGGGRAARVGGGRRSARRARRSTRPLAGGARAVLRRACSCSPGLLRLGFIAQFLSRPVMEGFVFGLAIFVTVSQLPKLFGIAKGGGDTIRQFAHLLGAPRRHERRDARGRRVRALALLFGARAARARACPAGWSRSSLGIAISAALDLSSTASRSSARCRAGCRRSAFPTSLGATSWRCSAAAGGMVLVIFSESLGAAQTFAAKYGYEIDPNQELIALGVANAGSGLVGGLAGGGSLSQSAVNEGAGARSEVSPLVADGARRSSPCSSLTPLFKDLPEAVLAALIIHAVSHLWKVARVPALLRASAGRVLARPRHARSASITLDVLPGLRDRRRLDAAARRLPREPAPPRRARPRSRRARRIRRRRPPPDYEPSPACSSSGSRRRCSTPTRPRARPHQGARRRRPTRRRSAVILDAGANDEPRHHRAEILNSWSPRCGGGRRLRAGRGAVVRARDGAALRVLDCARRGPRLPHGRPGGRRARARPSFIPSG